MRDRWKVQNLNYGWSDTKGTAMDGEKLFADPWQVVGPIWTFEYFATHAEAITYADKQARRTA